MTNDQASISAALNTPARLVVLPTNMGYVLAARAADQAATARLYAQDPDLINKPAIIIGESIEQLAGLGIVRRYLKAYEQYWPGAVAIEIPSSDPSLAYLRASQGSLVVCVPDDSSLADLLKTCGPLLTFSIAAIRSMGGISQPLASDIATIKRRFGRAVDQYFDGGNLDETSQATVIRVVDDAVEIVRAGAVDIRSE